MKYIGADPCSKEQLKVGESTYCIDFNLRNFAGSSRKVDEGPLR